MTDIVTHDSMTPFASALAASRVPPHLHGGLVRYFEERITPGGFLTAVLENNLLEALRRADAHSRAGLFALLAFLCVVAPGTAWGSPDAVAAWLRGDQP